VAADVIVLSSPVYFYSISAQLKTVIDRCVARWTRIKNKEFYYIAASGEDSQSALSCTIECFRGLATCFGNSQEKGAILAHGLYDIGEVNNSPYMQQAFEMGKNI